MVNCNPETVSTDYDTSDRLYFEPLTAEDVLEILAVEASTGTLKGVIVQFGGQTPLKLAPALEKNGIPILGTTVDSIDLAEDRDRFKRLLDKLDLRSPGTASPIPWSRPATSPATSACRWWLRPSNVLGGRAMAILRDDNALGEYLLGTLPGLVPSDVKARYPNDKTGQINSVLGKNPLLFDRYLADAVEVDVDALCDGTDVFVAGIMEHIEEAGIHSGDSACSLPPRSLSPEMLEALEAQTRRLALALDVVGLMNVQYAIKDGDIYVLEVNPRASRTVPFVAKVIGEPIAKIAARIMAGEKLPGFGLRPMTSDHVGVKEAVFPFARFPGVDTVLGPEMRSTGEVIGLDRSFDIAFAKSQLGGGTKVPTAGSLFVSVRDVDKPRLLRDGEDAGRSRLLRARHRRHLQVPGGARRRGQEDQQGLRGPPAHRRRHRQRHDPAGLQHDRGLAGAHGLALAAPRRALAQGAVLYDAGGGGRRLAGHQGLQGGRPGGAGAAGLLQVTEHSQAQVADRPPDSRNVAVRGSGRVFVSVPRHGPDFVAVP